MPQTRKFTIGEVAELLELAPKTIRHYHEIGVLPEPERTEGGYRLYTGAEIRRIQKIRALQAFGLSLKQIQFILTTDEPDDHLRAFLLQRDQTLAEEISQLQRQQARVQAFLRGDVPQVTSFMPTRQILQEVIKPASSHLADVLAEVESHPLAHLDMLYASESYMRFWEQVAKQLLQTTRPHEHQLILWLERYIALSQLEENDYQAKAWLDELRASSAPLVLCHLFEFPHSSFMPSDEVARIQRLLAMLLYEQATPLQKAFLSAIQR